MADTGRKAESLGGVCGAGCGSKGAGQIKAWSLCSKATCIFPGQKYSDIRSAHK